MPCGECADSDRIGYIAVPRGFQESQRRHLPSSACCCEKGIALGCRFEMSLGRGLHRHSQFRNLAEGGTIPNRDSAMSGRHDNRVIIARTVNQKVRNPRLAGGRIIDITRFHGPFETVGIGEGADRKRGR